MKSSPSNDQLIALVGAIRDEQITAEEVRQLEAMLSANPEARRRYRLAMRIHGLLEQSAAAVPSDGAVEKARPSAPRQANTQNAWLIAATVATLAAVLMVTASSRWLLQSYEGSMVAMVDDAADSTEQVTTPGDSTEVDEPDDDGVDIEALNNLIEQVAQPAPVSPQPAPAQPAPAPALPQIPDDEPDFAKLRAISIEISAPATNYRLEIESVHRVNDELWVVVRIGGTEDEVGGDEITELRDRVFIEPTDAPPKFKLVGAKWHWRKDDDSSQYIEDEEALKKLMQEKGARIKHLRKPGESPTAPIRPELYRDQR